MSKLFLAASIAAYMTPMLFAPEAETGTAAAAAAAPTADATKKSIVPAKYAGKYKGANDELAKFIDEQCSGKDGFEYTAFFQLCKLNGLDSAKVDHYATQVAEKRHGSQGRARMTLRNMLATIVRKDGKLKALDGTEHTLTIAKPALTGAAAAAHDKAETEQQASTETSTTETEGADANSSGSEPTPVETQSSGEVEQA